MDNKKIVEQIIKNKDIKLLLDSEDMVIELFLIDLVYNYYIYREYDMLNHEQKVIMLCSRLEDCCQADGLLSVTEDEELVFRMHEMYESLLEIGAVKTADFLKRFIELLPEDMFETKTVPEWKWFFEDERKKKIDEIDSGISHYPDGAMFNLYKKYIEKDNVVYKIFENL